MSYQAESFVSEKTFHVMSHGSAIRNVFTLGLELKKIHGEENVYDFSLGNPALEPVPEFEEAMAETVRSHYHLCHGYMPNAGLPSCREAVAKLVSQLQRTTVDADRIIMTTGAAGAANIVFSVILNPGDEVIRVAPYFVEYEHYTVQHGGVVVTAQSLPNYDLDLVSVEKAITPRTRAIIINSPNNPTGKVYSQATVNALGALLREKSKQIGRPIFLVSDDPYARIIYDKKKPHSTFEAYEFSFIVSSFSKDLSIPGERLGYIVACPNMPFWSEVMKPSLVLRIRTLGQVNAPAFMQRVVAKCADKPVDVAYYDERRIVLCEGLRKAGMLLEELPEGAFYAFPKIPFDVDEGLFLKALANKHVLCVPGSAFGVAGHLRFCYAVPMETITRALPLIKEVVDSFRK